MTEDRSILGKTISELYSEDPWVRGFMQEVYDLFGIPKSTETCLCRKDKIMFIWAMMNLVRAMNQNPMWMELRDKEEPQDAAYSFVKDHFEKTGAMLLDNLIEETAQETKEKK